MPQAPPRYPAAPPPASGTDHRRVVLVGGGLVGLTLALDLARHGVAVTLLDEEDSVATGSRAICFAKRTLEIYARLGLGPRMLEKGVTWQTGRVFHGAREAFHFDLLPEAGHEYPAFVNLQQYHVEEWLVEACQAAGVELRWRHRVAGLAPEAAGVTLAVETPQGPYTLRADWLLACDGARSAIRRALGLPFQGQVFQDRFLIADVVIRGEVGFPAERWFWFDPPFHPGQSVLLHKQPDDLWRIDFQLGWDADPEAEQQPARVAARVRAMLGPDVPFELEWVSLYTFRCRRLDRFVHGRVVFAGDSAHQVSPFGARGGNGGVQDADNLAWKLAAVLNGSAGPGLLDSYEAERIAAAEENILHAMRATDFITPKSDHARAYRDAVLDLAADHAFARALVNSGRLSRPAVLAESPLNSADQGGWAGGAPAGAAAPDAPVLCEGQPDWLLRHLGGDFGLLLFDAPDFPTPPGLRPVHVAAEARPGALWDHSGLAAARFGAMPGGAVLLRPDQHIAARLAMPDPVAVRAALERARGGGGLVP
ncbi:FAD-dependent oxidoreductase [Falsiroseomonas selenitidurans]|uniref:FAD-dependent oxidoreductase n=1 Tax=Falsiroseomonas selenitidurans TaxID=2716335 RepID=A0ABX1E7V8_9PROT|nr:FAD-dependent oxidoreductase [Falsiroseomonas selenitidurans]NKC31000.1 FAD-dependent oxidoreductase [Falsiroseomonas selenitidurans]